MHDNCWKRRTSTNQLTLKCRLRTTNSNKKRENRDSNWFGFMGKILPTKPRPRQPLHNSNKLNKRTFRTLSATMRLIFRPNKSRGNKNDITKTYQYNDLFKTSRIKINQWNAAITVKVSGEELNYTQVIIARFW